MEAKVSSNKRIEASQNLKFKVCPGEKDYMVKLYVLQFEFGNVDLLARICICLIVDLLAQGTKFCESSYQINLKTKEKVKKPKKTTSVLQTKQKSFRNFIAVHG